MNFLRLVCFLFFLAALLHVSLIAGFISRTPLLAQGFDIYLRNNQEAYFRHPFEVYKGIGNVVWESGYAGDILSKVYKPLLQKAGTRVFEKPGALLMDLDFLNWTVLASLGVFLLSFLAGRRRR